MGSGNCIENFQNTITGASYSFNSHLSESNLFKNCGAHLFAVNDFSERFGTYAWLGQM